MAFIPIPTQATHVIELDVQSTRAQLEADRFLSSNNLSSVRKCVFFDVFNAEPPHSWLELQIRDKIENWAAVGVFPTRFLVHTPIALEPTT